MKNKYIFVSITIFGILAIFVKTAQPSRVNYMDLSTYYIGKLSKEFMLDGFIVVDLAGRNTIQAIHEQCVVSIATSQTDGDNDAAFIRAFGVNAEVFFSFRNQKFSSRPHLKIFMFRLLARLVSITGKMEKTYPVWAVSLPHSCEERSRHQIVDILRRASG